MSFKYSPTFKRQIRRPDGSWINITFNNAEQRNPFMRENEEHIHRAFTNLYLYNNNFRFLIDGGEFVQYKASIAVIKNFHQGVEEANPHINFKFHNHPTDTTYHAYFDTNGEICRVSYVVDVL